MADPTGKYPTFPLYDRKVSTQSEIQTPDGDVLYTGPVVRATSTIRGRRAHVLVPVSEELLDSDFLLDAEIRSAFRAVTSA